MGPQLASAVWTAGITIVVIFVALIAVGFWIVARRKTHGHGVDAQSAKQQQANVLLVRVDDAVKNAEDELGFALAQFGTVKTTEFETVLTLAKSQLREAFSLQQKLDDAYLDTPTQRREWTARIIHLCESAQGSLGQQENEFAELRQQEVSAPDALVTVRKAIEKQNSTISAAKKTLATLKRDYVDSALVTITDNISTAQSELAAASSAAADAESTIAERASATAATTTATDAIRSAEEHVRRASHLLEAVGALKDELRKASDAVTALRESTRKNLTEAGALRDAPPDADSSSSVARAIETVEAALSAKEPLSDPLVSLEVLRAANAELDSSMAGARNQQRRLDGARTALVGALVGARSQLTATRNYITTRRNGVGSEARTRLAEAERLLSIAEAESDPVAALDTARSSATYSRDADALARYDLMGRS